MICKSLTDIWRLFSWHKFNTIDLEMLQRLYKIVILGTLGMPGHTYQNWQYQPVGKFRVYFNAKINFISPFPFEILQQILQTRYFGYFGNAWL